MMNGLRLFLTTIFACAVTLAFSQTTIPTEEYTELIKKSEALKQKEDEIKTLKTTNKGYKDEIEQLKEDNERLTGEKTKLEGRVDKNTLRFENKQLSVDKERLERQLSSVRDSLKAAQGLIDSLEKEIPELKDEAADLRVKLESSDNSINRLEKKNERIKNKASAVDSTIQARDQTIEKLKSELAKYAKYQKEEIAAIEAETTALTQGADYNIDNPELLLLQEKINNFLAIYPDEQVENSNTELRRFKTALLAIAAGKEALNKKYSASEATKAIGGLASAAQLPIAAGARAAINKLKSLLSQYCNKNNELYNIFETVIRISDTPVVQTDFLDEKQVRYRDYPYLMSEIDNRRRDLGSQTNPLERASCR